MAEKMTEEEIRCLEIKKKLPSVCRNVNYTHQIHNLYKKMAQDMDKEWERTTFFYQKEIPFLEETVQENWTAVLLTERKLNLLRKKKKKIAAVKSWLMSSSSLTFPKWPFCSCYSKHNPQRPRTTRGPLNHQVLQEGGGRCYEAQGSGSPADSTQLSQQGSLNTHNHSRTSACAVSLKWFWCISF